jgi:succinate-semialdehyde dehydrogenase
MPWNFPVWQVLRGAVPALLAGNTYVLKHAPNVMGSAYAGELFKDAGLPRRVRSAQRDPGGRHPRHQRPAHRRRDPDRQRACRHGDRCTGRCRAEKCVLELGGSDPFIVLADADLDAAVKAAVIGRYQNTGQVCAAAKRLIVEASIVEQFTRKFVEATRAAESRQPAGRRHLHRPDGPL